MDITHLKIKDKYTNRMVSIKTTEELGEWLVNATATKSEALYRTVGRLVNAMECGTDYTWHAAANGLEIEERNKGRKRK